MPITFLEKDNEGVQFLHNDMIDIILNIENYNVRYIHVDNGNSIVFYVMMPS